MVKFRALQLSDADYMCEFLDDPDISGNFLYTRYPFSKDNFIEFIKSSWGSKSNIHYAIVDENDEYVGTISLKNVNYIDRNAEYAIVIRKKYWGKDYAYEATKKIIEYGFNRLNMHKIYLNVLSSNIRANKFYEKYGFIKENTFKEHVYINGRYEDLNWYYVLNDESK